MYVTIKSPGAKGLLSFNELSARKKSSKTEIIMKFSYINTDVYVSVIYIRGEYRCQVQAGAGYVR